MHRTVRWGLPALAAAVVPLAAPAAPATAEPEEPALPHCYSEALTAEEVADGATSVVECFEEPLALRGETVLARLYVGYGGAGYFLDITGTSCSGAGAELGGTGWDNVVHSVRNGTCANSKHYNLAGRTGDAEGVSGTSTLQDLTTLAGRVTSVGLA